MYKSLASCILFLLTAAMSCGEQPNIIIIFADDLGYGDLGTFGAEGYETPELDQMAAEGMRFTEFYVSESICSPSRASLLTGRYPVRWRSKGGVYWPHSQDGMPPSEVTIAELLKAVGYDTALVGKWHLGHAPKFLPTNQGFDHYYGIPFSNDMTHDGDIPLAKDAVIREGFTKEDYYALRPRVEKSENRKAFKGKSPLMRDHEVIQWPVDQAQLTKLYTEEAVAFIEAHSESGEASSRPFFLMLAHTMPHIPLYASAAFKGTTERGLYGDVIAELDWSVGQVLQTLRDTGLDKNTLVVFTSDNGPWLTMGERGGSSGKLFGGKGTTYEGGQRVPTIFWWPDMVSENAVCNEMAATLDLLPTVVGLAGGTLPDDRQIDGIDIRPLFSGDEIEQRDFFLYGWNQAIREGDWKYRKGQVSGLGFGKGNKEIVVQLFNLKDDPGETQNLAHQYPEIVSALEEKLRVEWKRLKEE
ncbi:MAG: sulfatase [Verrucomicrobiota bacterium]